MIEDIMTIERPKITDIYEDKVLTRTERNEYGQWENVRKEMRYKRPVNDLTIGLRLVNLILDITVFQVLGYILEELKLLNHIPFSGLIFMFLFPIYYIVGEFYFQQTVGKFFTKSAVVNEYGDKPDFQTIIIRTVIRFIPIEPFSFFANNRGWHDKWTKTYVIEKSEIKKIKDLMANQENLQP
jgi:uncharacterized RDD family membrane protein YckC